MMARRHSGWLAVGLAWLVCLSGGREAASAQQTEPLDPQPGPNNLVVSLFQKPFVGDFALVNFFDHDLPFEFEDTNGYQLTWWGERTVGIDGHDGYDWLLPQGTPLLAVADGLVVVAGETSPVPCPPLGHETTEHAVILEHTASTDVGTLRIRSAYAHMSRVDVQPGQQVTQGEQIGASGNSGCSTAPHLHFQALRFESRLGRFVLTDPYGWDGPDPDPWAQHPQGAPSSRLWQANQAPAIFREVRLPPNPHPGENAPVAITRFRWMGWRDEANPNNEFVELTVDPRFAPGGAVDLTGFTLRNNRGDRFAFPAGYTITQNQPIRVFMGVGQATATELYWGRSSGVWDHMGDCVRLAEPNGRILYALTYSGCS